MPRFHLSGLKKYGVTGRLSIRLFYYVVVCSACFTVSVSAWQLWLSYRQEMAAIDQTFQMITASFLPSLTKSLYELDDNQITIQLEGMLLLPDVCYVEILDFSYNATPLSAGIRLAQSPVTREFELTKTLANKPPIVLGKLTVQINLRHIYARLGGRTAPILLVNASQIFVTGFVIMLLAQTVFIRHLIDMARYAEQLDIDTLEPALTLQRQGTGAPDELDLVAQALNNLRARLQQDRHARAAAEEALRNSELRYRTLSAELEQRVSQRTAELEAANKELKDFAYVVSHDLKAPLRAISRLVQWLVEDYTTAFDAKGQKMAELLVGRVKRMDALIDGILEYSRIGRTMGPHDAIDLNLLLPDVIDLLNPPPTMRIEIAPDLPTLMGDKIRIQQVFQNLIGNAIKFMDKPQGKIAVNCADDGAFWRFSVTDNGPGIDPKYHGKVFQIFQTLHPRDELESTGVGLAIVKKIVEWYGGTIAVASETGQGSAFWFTFPRTRREEQG